MAVPKKLNKLIPMESPDGGRTFVNAWDVPSREKDGWTVVGKIAEYTARSAAPVEQLEADKGTKRRKLSAAADDSIAATDPTA